MQLYVDGSIIRAEDVTLNPLETKEFTSPWKLYELGNHNIVANPGEVSKTISVKAVRIYNTANPRVTIANYGGLFTANITPSERVFWEKEGTSIAITTLLSLGDPTGIVALTTSIVSVIDIVMHKINPPTFEVYVQHQYSGGEAEFYPVNGDILTRKPSEPIAVMIIYEGGKKSPQGEIFNIRANSEHVIPHYDIFNFNIECPSTYYTDGFFVIYLDGSINEEGIWTMEITHDGEKHGFSVEVGEFTSIIDHVKGIIDDLWENGQKLFAFKSMASLWGWKS